MGEPFIVTGVPIDALIVGESGAPRMLETVIDFIIDQASVEGVFRKPGNRNTVETLSFVLSVETCPIIPSATVHDCISFLKLWMIELPVPLLVPQAVNDIYDINDTKSVHKLLYSIPEVNRKSLLLIVIMLRIVLSNTESNKMTMSNLRTCFETALVPPNKGYEKGVDFQSFLEECWALLNEDFTDFVPYKEEK